MTKVYFVSDHKVSEIKNSDPSTWFEDVFLILNYDVKEYIMKKRQKKGPQTLIKFSTVLQLKNLLPNFLAIYWEL